MKQPNQTTNHQPISRGATWLALLLCLILPLQPVLAGEITYYHNDASGSPVMASDAEGNIIWREHYAPYGEKLNNPVNEDIGYTGHEYDAETGLTYMQARYYDPVVGRFLAIDPVGFKPNAPMTFNRYSYANNNPYKYVDPDGREIVIAAESAKRVAKGLALLASTPSGRKQISGWQKSDVVIGFAEHPAGKNSVTYAGGSYKMDTANGEVTAEVAVYLGPENEEVYIDTAGKPVGIDDGEVLAHEGAHVDNYLKNGSIKGSGNCGAGCVNEAETNAVKQENTYRAESGQTGKRTKYNGTQIKEQN